MTDALETLNHLPDADAEAAFRRCCGAERWTHAMVARRPFASPAALFAVSDEIWWKLSEDDWREAFAHHPRIGDKEALRAKYAGRWSEGEQAEAAGATDAVLDALAEGNLAYEARFGHIFIVCATGKTAAEMLALLRARLPNAPDAELRIAAEEQRKITRLRLEKLLTELKQPAGKSSE